MKRLRAQILLCLLFVYPFLAYSGLKTDSIKSILLNQTTIDAQYIQILSELSFESWAENPDEGRKYAEKAQHLADSLGDERGKAFALLGVGLNSWGQENFNEAMPIFLEAEKKIAALGDSNDIMLFKYQIAVAYQGERIIDLSNKRFRELIPYYKRTGNEAMLAFTYKAFGMNYAFEKSKDEERRYKSFRHAIQYLDSSEQIFAKLNNNYEIAELSLYQGIASLQLDDLVDADHLFNKALKAYESFNDIRGIVMAEKEIGGAFSAVNQKDSADVHLARALDLALKNELEDELYELYYFLYELAYNRENYKEALEYYQKHTSTFDKKVNRQISYQVHEMKMKYDKEKNEQAILLLNQEKELRDTYIVSLSILIIVLSISAVIIGISFRNTRKKDKELSESKEALMQAEISNSKLKEKELSAELEKKNMELTSYTMNFIQKGTLMTELLEKIDHIDDKGNEKLSSSLRELRSIIKMNLSSDKDWDDFRKFFENVHPSFINALNKKRSDLTNAEIRLAALLKMNLNSKQIADVMGISPDSVKTARHRLRNKFELTREQNLTQFLNKVEAEAFINER